jgi:hypothetical protein
MPWFYLWQNVVKVILRQFAIGFTGDAQDGQQTAVLLQVWKFRRLMTYGLP